MGKRFQMLPPEGKRVQQLEHWPSQGEGTWVPGSPTSGPGDRGKPDRGASASSHPCRFQPELQSPPFLFLPFSCHLSSLSSLPFQVPGSDLTLCDFGPGTFSLEAVASSSVQQENNDNTLLLYASPSWRFGALDVGLHFP